MSRRPVFVCWISFHGRPRDLGTALGVDVAFISAGATRNPRTAPFRWSVQAARTVALLARRRPSALYVMAPPLPLLVLGLAYGKVARVPVVIDAHSAAVVDRKTGRRVSRVFPRLARHADATIVTTRAMAAMLEPHGVRTAVIHDPPESNVTQAAPVLPRSRPVAVMPSSWDDDEPIETVVEAARLAPDVEFVLTGRPRRALEGEIPTNVTLTGYLSTAEFDGLLAGSDVVLALTTAEHTMQRAGYEAMAHGRPLVASNTDALRSYFDGVALFVDATDAAGVAGAVGAALTDAEAMARAMVELRGLKVQEFEAGLAELERLVR